jgi:UDP-2,4-diacetamido-2,4,6-trideoxy-beta-L-altropyranose hydrolase
LAQACQKAGGKAVFACSQLTEAIERRLREEHNEIARVKATPGSIEDAIEVLELASRCGADWTVVDGYQFNEDYHRELREKGLKILRIDDIGGGHYCADLLLNPNLHATEELYRSREPHTRTLLGPNFALLRREFQAWRDWRREIVPTPSKLLVTMGGSDPGNLTARILDALASLGVGDLEVTVIVGGSSPHFTSVEERTAILGSVRVLQNPTNIPALMAWADVAISAAGSTAWELCYMGLPAVLIDVAENQRPVARELSRRGVAMHAGSSDEVTPSRIATAVNRLLESRELRSHMSKCGRELVDGRGAERVLAAMQCGSLRLRRVEESDCRLLWEWVNDPLVRSASFSTEQISWDNHVSWFHGKLADHNSAQYVVEAGSRPVGQVRFQIEGGSAVVSVSLASEFRGKGLGAVVVAMATEDLFRTTPVTRADAFVKPGNTASLRLFNRAGFAQSEITRRGNHEAVHFVLERKDTA